MKQPTPAEIKAARTEQKLTQAQAAELVHASAKAWQNWESEKGNGRKMALSAWALFLLRTER